MPNVVIPNFDRCNDKLVPIKTENIENTTLERMMSAESAPVTKKIVSTISLNLSYLNLSISSFGHIFLVPIFNLAE